MKSERSLTQLVFLLTLQCFSLIKGNTRLSVLLTIKLKNNEKNYFVSLPYSTYTSQRYIIKPKYECFFFLNNLKLLFKL